MRRGCGLLLGPGRGRRDDECTKGAGRGLGAVWDVFSGLGGCVQSWGECVQFLAGCVHFLRGCVHSGGECVQCSAGAVVGRGWHCRRCRQCNQCMRCWWCGQCWLGWRWRRAQCRVVGGRSARVAAARIEAAANGRPRCVQRGRFEVWSATTPSQGRGALVREQVQSRTRSGLRG